MAADDDRHRAANIDRETARLLAEYLRPDKETQAGPREEMRDIRTSMQRLSEDFQRHVIEDERFRGDLLRMHDRQERAERRLEELEAASEVTGVENVSELRERYKDARAQLAKRDDETTATRRLWMTWGLGLVSAGLAGAIGWLARFAFHGAP